MLVRIVRLTIDPEELDTFLQEFDAAAPRIRQFPGCNHLELWKALDRPNICTTCSHWVDSEALNAYRDSELFRSTWSTVKPLFAAPPDAHSYTVSRPAASIERAANNLDVKNG